MLVSGIKGVIVSRESFVYWVVFGFRILVRSFWGVGCWGYSES